MNELALGLDINATFSLMHWWLVCSFVIQDIEYFSLSRHFTRGGVWDWEILRKDFSQFPAWLKLVFDFLFSMPSFLILIAIRSGLGLASLYWSDLFFLYGLMFLSSLLICIRWKGAFNGGSDYMGLMLSGALALFHFPANTPEASKFILFYISFQLILSYFWAGVVKIKLSAWRRGLALPIFLNHSPLKVPLIGSFKPSWPVRKEARFLLLICSWFIMLWELSFPLAVINLQFFCFYFLSGMFFHLLNFFLLGLNRFVWVWPAAYPALLYCVHNWS